MSNWRRTCLGILLAPFFLLFLFVAGTSLHAGWRHSQRLLSIQWEARQFGYTSDLVSVRGRGCDNRWIDGEDCTLFLVFTSARSLDEVHLQENVYHPGESVSFTTAFVNDNTLLTNAQITVTLLTPDGQTTYLPTTP